MNENNHLIFIYAKFNSEDWIKLKTKYEEISERLRERRYYYYLPREEERLVKGFEMVSQLCEIKEGERFTIVEVNPYKFYKAGVKDELNEVIGKITELMNFLFQFKPVELVYTSEAINDFVRILGDLWLESMKIRLFSEDLSIRTDNPMFRNLPLRAWSCEEGKRVYENGKEVLVYELKRPMYWEEDREVIEANGFILTITPEQEVKLNELKRIEEEEYYTVYIKPHEDGIKILLYQYIDEEYRRRLERHCEIKYYIAYDEENPSRSKYTILRFIERKPELDEEKRICYVAKYFTLPTIRQYFINNGFVVDVDPSLIHEIPKLPFKVKPKFKLYNYPQAEAFKNWERNNFIGTIEMPTGTGKTHLGLWAIARLNTWTLIVVPTINLKNQWIEFLQKWLDIPREYIGEYYSGKKEIKPITIALIQSASKRVKAKEYQVNGRIDVEKLADEELLRLAEEVGKLTGSFGLFITDEGHHLAAPVWQKIAIHLKCLNRMSLTATPRREDRNEPLIFFTMGDVVFSTTYYKVAVKSVPQLVSPIKFKRIWVDLTDEERRILELVAELKGKKAKYKELKYSYYMRHKREELANEILELQQELEMLWLNHPYIREGGSKNISIMRIVHCYAKEKFDRLLEIVKRHREDRILVFNEYVRGTKLISDFLKSHGIEHFVMTGSTPESERQEILTLFKLIPGSIIVTTTVLDEGIDVPDCSVVVIFNGTKTKRQMIQRIGRGCRYRPCKIEYVYELVVRKHDIQRPRGWLGIEEHIYYEELRRLLNYEYKISMRRDPSEIIEPEKQEELIAKVEEKLKAGLKCSIKGCFEERGNNKFGLCNYHVEMLKRIYHKSKNGQRLNPEERLLVSMIKNLVKS